MSILLEIKERNVEMIRKGIKIDGRRKKGNREMERRRGLSKKGYS